MSRFRPRSAFLVALLIVLGCNSAAPFKMFRKAESDTTELLGENNSSDQSKSETVVENQKSADPSRLVGDPSQAVVGTPLSEGNKVAGEGQSQLGTASRRLSDTSQQKLAGVSEQSENPATPPAAEQERNPIKLASASRNPLEAFRLMLPGRNKEQGDALVDEIDSFQQFAFAFNLPTVAGEEVDSSQFSGQLMVIDIWATWCGPCKKAIPDFIAIQEEFQSHGIQVIGITCDSPNPEDAPETARRAYAIGQQMGVNYPLLVDDGTTTEQVPGFRGYPTTLFMTPDGIVRYKVTGVQSKEKLATTINTILQR